MKKSFKIEDNWALGFIESKCKAVVNSNVSNIDECLNLLWVILGTANDYINIGRGGHHIWISDVWNKRMAIIYFQD